MAPLEIPEEQITKALVEALQPALVKVLREKIPAINLNSDGLASLVHEEVRSAIRATSPNPVMAQVIYLGQFDGDPGIQGYFFTRPRHGPIENLQSIAKFFDSVGVPYRHMKWSGEYDGKKLEEIKAITLYLKKPVNAMEFVGGFDDDIRPEFEAGQTDNTGLPKMSIRVPPSDLNGYNKFIDRLNAFCTLEEPIVQFHPAPWKQDIQPTCYKLPREIVLPSDPYLANGLTPPTSKNLKISFESY